MTLAGIEAWGLLFAAGTIIEIAFSLTICGLAALTAKVTR